jgi:hypothetical protein
MDFYGCLSGYLSTRLFARIPATILARASLIAAARKIEALRTGSQHVAQMSADRVA